MHERDRAKGKGEESMQPRSILFAGRRNAARSLIAESCFNAADVAGWRAFSAGWSPCESADGHALAVLRDNGLPSEGLQPKAMELFCLAGAPQIDLCVFLDANAPEIALPDHSRSICWHIPDPQSDPSPNAYARVLDLIGHGIAGLIISGEIELRYPPMPAFPMRANHAA